METKKESLMDIIRRKSEEQKARRSQSEYGTLKGFQQAIRKQTGNYDAQ